MRTCFATVALLIAVSLPNATSGPISAAQTSTVCDETTLPAQVNELLKAKFARWRPERVSDLDADDQKFRTEEHLKECPGIAVGHFESADSLLYAVLLVPRSEQQGGYQIVVSSKGLNVDAYTWRVLEHAEGKTHFAPVISKASPGTYPGFDDTKSVRIKLDGIDVERVEKSALIYYWSGGCYRNIWTSD